MTNTGEHQRRNNESGMKTNELAADMLNSLKNKHNLNITIEKNYTIGYPQMDKQFKMDFCISFHDFNDKQWLIKATNTIRDRIYGTEFFAQNILEIDSAENRIEKIFVVVPNSLSEAELANAKRYSAKIKGNRYKSFLTDVITIGELRELILIKCESNNSQGDRANVLGKDAENRVTYLLNNEDNWRLWNNYNAHTHNVKSDTFSLFKKIIKTVEGNLCAEYVPSTIRRIEATKDIPKLEGRGYPKTDVSFSIEYEDDVVKTHNITVKRTEKETVTVHEGDVGDLIKCLSLEPCSQLAVALMAFQKYGSRKQMEASEDTHLVCVLDNELQKHNRALVEFAIFGMNSPRVNFPETQVADCILFFNNSDDNGFWLREQYIENYLKAYENKGQFGTPFQWTYPSKKRGTRIQLKGFTSINNKPQKKGSEGKLRFIDLFAGIGGIRKGFEDANTVAVFSSEWDKFAVSTYEANFGETPFGDITKICEKDIPEHDVLLAGFPCQPFSNIGRREGFSHATQGTLFFDVLRILKYHMPKIFLLENVVGLLNIQEGAVFRTILDSLRELGYSVFWDELDAQNFGLPQIRRRVLIVGFHPDMNVNEFTIPQGDLTYRKPIKDILEQNLTGYEISKHLQKSYLFKKDDGRPQLVDSNSKIQVKTLCATYHKIQRLTGTFVKDGPTDIRLLSELECKRLMGFPDDFIVPVSRTQMYRQFGNSVCVPMIKAVADAMKSVVLRV